MLEHEFIITNPATDSNELFYFLKFIDDKIHGDGAELKTDAHIAKNTFFYIRCDDNGEIIESNKYKKTYGNSLGGKHNE